LNNERITKKIFNVINAIIEIDDFEEYYKDDDDWEFFGNSNTELFNIESVNN